MGKQTKRARKFASKGGVKARLEKGTITNKGKLKSRTTTRRNDGSRKHSAGRHPHDRRRQDDDEQQQQLRNKREESDFVGQTNLGDMDLDSFFEIAADKIEHEEMDDENASLSASSSSDDDDDDEGKRDNENITPKRNEKKPAPGESSDSSSSTSSDDDDKEEENEDGSDSDSDDDDDVDAAADRMKREMEKLQQSDPEFHKFLAENEESLLEFGEDGQHEDQVEDSAEIPEETHDEQEKKSAYITVDAEFLKNLERGTFKAHGMKSLRKLVAVYKTACHLSDANKSQDDEEAERKRSSKRYTIDSSDVFDQLMVMCLSRCCEEFHHHLVGNESTQEIGEGDLESIQEDKPIPSRYLARSPHWNDIKPVFLSFMKSTMKLLTEAKEPELLTFVLKALSKYVRYLTAFPRIAENLLKTLVNLWSAPLDTSEDYQVVRLNAFIRIRQLALTQPFPFIETCLKKTYLAYANRAKFATSASVLSLLPTLTFMGNCVVELYGLDYHSSYQHAFVYIRQLALHLRTAIQKKTPEALQAVYCWQYIHCLKLWVAVIVASCRKDDDDDQRVGRTAEEAQMLRSLIFPLTEVILGVARLVPTTRHLPLRLHCVRFLQQLAASAEVFIPTTSILLDVLDMKEIGMRPKKVHGRAASRGLQLALILKLPKESPLRTHEQLEACVSEVFLLLNREVELYRYSAGFPEFTVAIRQRLHKFSKETKNARWRTYSKGCIDLCDRYSSFAVRERALLGEAPKDIKRLEVLKPTNEPDMGSRHDAAIAKEKRLEAVTRPATATNSKRDRQELKANDDETTASKKAKKEKRQTEINRSDLANTSALEEDDEVAEGINWSDDDSEQGIGESSDDDSN